MTLRLHAIMQDSDDLNAHGDNTVVDVVMLDRQTPIAGTNPTAIDAE
jgi:hypothetical protein